MMMFGFGWLMMLLVFGLPILLVVLLLIGAAGYFQNRGHNIPFTQNQVQSIRPAANTSPSTSYSRYCSHCGAGLQSDWTHCPQCGAPIE